ncbi:cardioactive peptide-like [Uloborus diversus]|uniref:cardioactive peptide-like n=1 Tax=Uloborus diversus TaxID=327109 RepID=UPI0024094FE4|nr:cardioactive peptide-like [Uloborus diversus]
MVHSTCLTFVILTLLAIIFTVTSDSLDQDRMDLPLLQKRPFCNAFTGCGRKRSGARSGESSDMFTSRQGAQNKLYAMLQQKMAEVEALRGILDENQNRK